MATRLTPQEILARAMLEDDLLSVIAVRLIYGGWTFTHIRNSKRGVTQGHTGVPDITAVKAPRLMYLELKREREQLRADQEHWRQQLEGVPGVEYHVVRPSDWMNGTVEEWLHDGQG